MGRMSNIRPPSSCSGHPCELWGAIVDRHELRFGGSSMWHRDSPRCEGGATARGAHHVHPDGMNWAGAHEAIPHSDTKDVSGRDERSAYEGSGSAHRSSRELTRAACTNHSRQSLPSSRRSIGSTPRYSCNRSRRTAGPWARPWVVPTSHRQKETSVHELPPARCRWTMKWVPARMAVPFHTIGVAHAWERSTTRPRTVAAGSPAATRFQDRTP
jgi:hypothetical protein